MGPEFVGKTKDNMTKDSQDLSPKAVEEPFDEAQTVLETRSIDATNGYEKDANENPTDQMAEKQKLSSQDTVYMLRVWYCLVDGWSH